MSKRLFIASITRINSLTNVWFEIMNLLQIFVYIFVTSFGRRNVGQSKIRMASDKVYDLLLFSGKQESVDVPTKISFVRQNKKKEYTRTISSGWLFLHC